MDAHTLVNTHRRELAMAKKRSKGKKHQIRPDRRGKKLEQRKKKKQLPTQDKMPHSLMRGYAN